jgi:hypothetical protein
MMSALPMIPLAVGANRVVRGVRVEHVCGDPGLSTELDRALSHRIIEAAIRAIQTPVDGPTEFIPADTAADKEAASVS